MLKLDEELLKVIMTYDLKKVKKLLKKGANPNALKHGNEYTLFLESCFGLLDEEDKTYDLVKLLIEYGADVNGPAYPILEISNIANLEKRELYKKVLILLLENGADTNPHTIEFKTPLWTIIHEHSEDDVESAEILLKYGAKIHYCWHIEKDYTPYYFSSLGKASKYSEVNLVKFLLNNGADTSIAGDDDDKTPLEKLEFMNEISIELDGIDNGKLDKQTRKELEILLDPQNSPYLKLGEDKYNIYDKKNNLPFVLADLKKHKDKKYLYNNVEVPLLFIWAYKNNLLENSVKDVVKLLEDRYNGLSNDGLIEMFKETMGSMFTVDYIKKDNNFIVDYLGVTKWAFSYYFDIKKLYNTEKHFPVTKETKKSYEKVFRLLDMRYGLYQENIIQNANEPLGQFNARMEGREYKRKIVLDD